MIFNGSSPTPYENIENDDFIYHFPYYDQPEDQIQEQDLENSWQQHNLIEPQENIENQVQFYHFVSNIFTNEQCSNQPEDQIQEQPLVDSQQQNNPIEECQSAIKNSEIKKKIKKQNKKVSKKPSKQIIQPFDKLIPFEEDFNRIIGKQIFEFDLNQENDLSEKFKSLEDVQKLFPKFSEFRKQLVEYLKEIYQTDQKCYIKFILLVVKYSIYNSLIKLKTLDDYGIQRRNNIRRQLDMDSFHEALRFVFYDLRKFSNQMHINNDLQDVGQINTFNSREQVQISLEQIDIQYSQEFNNLKWDNIIKQLKFYHQIGKNYYKSHNCGYQNYILRQNKFNDPQTDLDWLNERHGQAQSKAGKKKFKMMLKDRLDKNNIRDFTLNHHFTFVSQEFKALKSLYIEDIFNLIIEYGL